MYKSFDGEIKWKGPIERPKCRKEDNIKVDINITGCKDVDQIQLAQNCAQLSAVMNMVEPLGSTKDEKFLDHINNCQLLK